DRRGAASAALQRVLNTASGWRSRRVPAGGSHRAGGVHIQRVQRMAGGHEEAVVLCTTETQVGAALGQMDVRDVLAGRVVDAHAVELVEVGTGAAAEPAPHVAGDVDLDAVVGARAAGVDE